MKLLICLPFIIVPVFLINSCSGINSKESKEGVEETTAQWFEGGEWSKGLKLKPHESVDEEEFRKQYEANKQGWDKAFAYLQRTDLGDIAPGKYEIDGENVFAIITEGPPKDFEATKFEAHHNYIDIHYVLKGKEKIGKAPLGTASIIQEYDSTKDIAFYTAEGKYYESSPDIFFILFTGDAHRPGIKADESEVVKKLVIKVRKAV